jgi:hypothetical protein
MKTITISELTKMAEQHKVRTVTDEYGDTLEWHLVVRWTRKPECGTERYSKNWQTGETELGLSAEILTPIPLHWTANGHTADEWISQQVNSYAYIPGKPYIMAGWVTGHGSDNEIVIEAKTARLIGEVTL